MTYKYKGDGLGIPGLPHEISDKQAKAWEADYKADVARYKADMKDVLADLDKGRVAIHLEVKFASHPHKQLEAALLNGVYKKEGPTRAKPSKSKKEGD